MDFKFNVLQSVMKENHADGMIILSRTNLNWYTNKDADFALIVADKKKVHIFVDARDYQIFHAAKINAEIHLYKDMNSWISFVKSMKLERVLFEYDEISVAKYETCIEPLNIKNLLRFSGDTLRIVKTPEELKYLQKAADIACASVEHLKKWIKIGTSESAAAQELITFMIKQGASGVSFRPIISFGKNTSSPHNVPSNYKLRSGDSILVDCGCVYKGYCSDITRIWWIGKVNPKIKHMYEVALAANKLGIASAKDGMTGKELDAIVRNYVAKNYDGYDIPHGVGHGVGVKIHEAPWVKKTYTQKLLTNSVVTMEPGIYDSSIGGVRIEDTIVITKNGCKVLTSKSSK
ncbi:MAG: Xaa-Pro peptidase family protein [Mycoplasmataceae bacterium]|nr:Xaa-Pro peptidase family protein [Mycoplasmataceae bacterium]